MKALGEAGSGSDHQYVTWRAISDVSHEDRVVDERQRHAGQPRPAMLSFAAALFSATVLTGCLYSTHNFSSGTLLPAGQSQATVGIGRQPFWRCSLPESDSTGARHACNEDGSGTEAVTKTEVPKGSLDYRLGVRNQWGIFPGVELKWHLEIPTNPATMEFAMNLALPAAPAFKHAVGAGWGIGAWADNTFFLEYAVSRKLGIPLFFGNFRTTWLATQIGEVMGEDFAKPFPSNQHLVFQAGLGMVVKLGDWIIVPDFVVPHFSITVPQVPPGDRRFKPVDIPLSQWDANLGFGWTY